MIVAELNPGDIVEMPVGGERATFIATCPHPVYRGLWLVIWRMEGDRDGEWSFDALNASQEVGVVQAQSRQARALHLRKSLLTGRVIREVE